jgi:hypothetical protein
MQPIDVTFPSRESGPIDFEKYADVSRLGNGEAGQKLRKLEDDLVLQQKELGLSESKLDGTKRLFGKEFVTKNDLEQDEMAVKRNSIQLDSSETVEGPLSQVRVSQDGREATWPTISRRSASSSARGSPPSPKLAQAEAQLRSAEANYELQAQQRARSGAG